MNDVLTIALERQRDLRKELAEIDDFIGMAESLLRNAKAKSEPHPDLSEHPDQRERPAGPEQTERAERSEDAESQELTESAEQLQFVEIPDEAPEPVVRKFPWSNAQPPVRKNGADEDARPTRRNLMRREA